MVIKEDKLIKYLEGKFGKVTLNKFEELGKGVYGTAYLVDFELDEGNKRLVLKTMGRGGFGHDFKADIAHNLILANDTFNKLPKHIKSFDVVAEGKELLSIGDADEYYILMEEAIGEPYNNDLDRIFKEGMTDEDRKKVVKLAEYLAEIHKKENRPNLYVRRARDLVGHGEYIMGVLDGYPDGTEWAARRVEIVQKCVAWWDKLRKYKDRLAVIHGDYHPFNILFKDGDFLLLDRSRGEFGEPADDTTSLAMNFIFWSLIKTGKFEGDFKELWDLFFKTYLEKTGDEQMLEIIQPFFTFRAIVVANPIFYPDEFFKERGANPDEVRTKLLNFASNILDLEKFDLEKVNELI